MNLSQRSIATVMISLPMLFAMVYVVLAFQQQDYRPKIAFQTDLSRQQQNEVVNSLLDDQLNLFSLAEVKEHLEEIRWIHRVYITRKWPGDLLLDIRLQQAIAYWNDDGFINHDGEVFVADHIVGGDLPQLYGPSDSAERVMVEYLQLNRMLYRSGRAIEVLVLNERAAWEFQDESGLKVLLGTEDIHQRLERVIAVLGEVTSDGSMSPPARVDARYNNGVSIEWRSEAESLEVANNFNMQRDMSL